MKIGETVKFRFHSSIALVTIPVVIVLFQNCSRIGLSPSSLGKIADSTNLQNSSGGNGELYDGKLLRTLFNPGKYTSCNNSPQSPSSLIKEFEKMTYLITVSADSNGNCSENQTPLSVSTVQWSSTKDRLVFADELFVEWEPLVRPATTLLKWSYNMDPINSARLRQLNGSGEIQLEGQCDSSQGKVTINGDLISPIVLPCEDSTFSTTLKVTQLSSKAIATVYTLTASNAQSSIKTRIFANSLNVVFVSTSTDLLNLPVLTSGID